MKHITIFILTLLICFSHLHLIQIAHAEDSENEVKLPLITEIDGNSSDLTARNSSQTSKTLKTDEFLNQGDIVTVPKDSSLRLSYENGGEVLITEGTAFKVNIEEKNNSEISSIEIIKGKINGFFNNHNSNQNKKDTSKNYKLIIKTQNAVMGVRGTDFIVESDSLNSSLHTLEGNVDFSKTKEDLFKGDIQNVTKNRFISRKRFNNLENPTEFSRDNFLKHFKNQHPRLSKLKENSLKDIKSGSRKQRFNRARQKFKKHLMRLREGRRYRREKRKEYQYNSRKNFNKRRQARDFEKHPDNEDTSKKKINAKNKFKTLTKKHQEKMRQMRKQKRARFRKPRKPPPPPDGN